MNKQKYLSFIVVILVVGAGVFFLKNKNTNTPVDSVVVEVPDNNAINTPTSTSTTEVPTRPDVVNVPIVDKSSNLTEEQKDLLAQLKKSANARDYDTFALNLLEVYKNQWGKVSDFEKTESEFYMYTYDKYFMKGDLANALKFSTIVYDKISEAWRFRYLRILTLEKYGRDAFNVGDLVTAENYANKILQMMFRPEGANLLADVYISRIQTNIKDGNVNLAKQNLGFIWDYEVSTDRRATLEDFKTQLGL